ncbi:hypothetical protein OB920_05225 [Halobacteria archaeon HArc-gm2]|nr:hypothetical protein [Halobacteria archaeon HArc-gm2]
MKKDRRFYGKILATVVLLTMQLTAPVSAETGPVASQDGTVVQPNHSPCPPTYPECESFHTDEDEGSSSDSTSTEDEENTPTEGEEEPNAPEGEEPNAPANDESGSGGNGGLFGQLVPPDITQKAAESTITPVLEFTIGYVPTLGTGWEDDYSEPSSFPFNSVWSLYTGFSLPLALLISAGAVSVQALKMALPWAQNTHRSIRLAVKGLVAFIVGVAGHVTIVSIAHDLARELALAIGPSTSELTDGAGSFLKFSVESVFILGSLHQMGWEFIKYLAVMYGIVWLLLVMFAIFSPPLFVLRVYFTESTLGGLAGNMLWVYAALLAAAPVQAMLVRIAWALDWGMSLSGIVAAFLSLAFLLASFLVPPGMVLLALFSRGKVLAFATGAATALASGAVGQKLSQKRKEAYEKARQETIEKGKQAQQGLKQRKDRIKGQFGQKKMEAKVLAGLKSGNLAYAGKAADDHYDVSGQAMDYVFGDSDSESEAAGEAENHALAEHNRQMMEDASGGTQRSTGRREYLASAGSDAFATRAGNSSETTGTGTADSESRQSSRKQHLAKQGVATVSRRMGGSGGSTTTAGGDGR